jgi:hypothetical protein
VAPSYIFNWIGPKEHLTSSSERIAAEEKWYALTGRAVELRAEADGDLHIALQDATGDRPGSLSLRYRQNRNGVSFAKLFWLDACPPPIITVIGKAGKQSCHAVASRKADLGLSPKFPKFFATPGKNFRRN